MYCDSCGSQLQDNQAFCHSCGKSFTPGRPPAPPKPAAAQGRVARNLGLLGGLSIAYSLLHFIPMGALAVLPLRGGWMHATGAGWGGWHGMPDGVGALFGPILGFGFILCVLGIVAGWGLIARQSWARVLAIIFGCLALLSFPFGTALGIYTLWVLVPGDSEREYRQMTGVA